MGFSLKKAFKKSLGISTLAATAGAYDGQGGGWAHKGGGGNDQLGPINADFAAAQSAATLANARSEAERRRSIGETRKAYAGARDSLGVGRTNAIQYAQDAGAVQQGQAAQSLASRGLYNSTVLDNAQQGVSAGVSRAVSDIEARYAQLNANLGIGEASDIAGIRERIAGGAERLGSTQAGLHTSHAGILASLPQEDPDAWLNDLLGIGGMALGYGITGGFGGGGGGGGYHGGGIF